MSQNGTSQAHELHGIEQLVGQRKDTVPAIPFDILRRHHGGIFLWLEATADIQMAKTRLRQLHANCRGTILFSTREASKLSPDPRSWRETTFMALKLLLVSASCSTRTCKTSYVVYLMFIDKGPRYSSPTRKGRTNHRETHRRMRKSQRRTS
jgi:hypothetical protein